MAFTALTKRMKRKACDTICHVLVTTRMPRIIIIITYLLTPCTRVILEKLTGLQPVKKFPAFYGTQRFITAFTSARQLSLS